MSGLRSCAASGQVLLAQSIAPRRRELRNFHEVVSAADAQLATLATACTQRLTQRVQHREKQVTQSIYSHQKLVAILPPGTLMMSFK